MRAKDIMTSPVVSVTPDTTVREIAALLFERRISAVPVLENGRLVGLVSEADLLRRYEIGTDRVIQPRSWWLRLLLNTDRTPAEYIKSHATRARDIMTREVVAVALDTPLADIAALLEARGIKRVPVLDGASVVGMVSRANLVRALVMRPPVNQPKAASDQAIRGRLLGELERQPWWRRVTTNVVVSGGIVHYWGMVDSDEERDAARVAAENVPGVSGIEDHRFEYHDIPSMI